MTISFRPAKRESVGLIIGLAGASGSGKTYTAMRLASGIAGDKPFAVIDTEAGRAKHYADRFRFDHADLHPPFAPSAYQEAITAADKAGYPVIVVDSFSHEHAGEGGILDMQEAELKRLGGGDNVKMLSWVKPKGEHRRMVSKLLQCRAHLILCMRAEDKIEVRKKPGGGTEIVPKETLAGFKGWIPICEKNLPYELTVSILLLPDHPGVPHPIKLQEQHKHLFPLDKPITEETGAALAAWARGGVTQEPARSPARGERENAASSPGEAKGGAGTPPVIHLTDEREQVLKDIVAELQKAHPGQERAAVEAKARLLNVGFGVRQWTKIQPLPSATLKAGLEKIRADLRQTALPEVKAPDPVIARPPVEDPIGPISDEQELHRELDRWDPPIAKETRGKLFTAMFGTDDIEKVDFAACQDAIELFKKVAAKDAAAIAEVNRLLTRAA